MLSSANTNIGVELPRDIDSCVNWKTAPKGRRRAIRRSWNSVSGEGNTQKAATTSSNGSDNASDEEFKDANQVMDSESDMLGVTVLRRRFTGPIQSVPIKKRMRLTGTSAPLPLDNGQASTPEAGSASFVEGSCHGNPVDFSGISMLADAACKGDLPDEDINNLAVSQVQSPKGENGVVMPQEASELQPPKYEGSTVVALESSSTPIEATEVLNDGSDGPSKEEKVSWVPRLHWDLNTVMDGWDSDQQDDDGANCQQNGAAGACNTEVCNEQKEESEKKDENENQPIPIKKNGDVLENAAPKENFESHATELRKENDIVTDANPKDSISESIMPPRNCSDTIPSFVSSSVKEEIKSENEIYSDQLSSCEHEQLSTCKPAEINPQSEPTTGPEQILEECFKEAVAHAKSEPTSGPEQIWEECTKEAVASAKSEPTIGPEQILEECTKESVANAPGLELKDAMMGNEQVGIDAMMGGNIVERDSMAVDDKLEHGAWQSDCDRHAEAKNCADLPHIETGLMPASGNNNYCTTDDREKTSKQVDSIIGAKVGVEVAKHTSSVEFHNNGCHSGFYPPKKDLEEDDDQYEDGELREPAMQYWGTNDGFEEAVTRHGPHEVDEQGNYIMETLPDASVMGSFTLDASQGEDKLLVPNAGVQLDNCIDSNMISKLDVDSKAQTERLENGQEINLTENVSAEYMHSLKAKATGWDKQPESSRKNSESPLRHECRPDSLTVRRDPSLGIDTLRSTDDSLRNDKSFVRPRRSKEDDLDGRLEWNLRTSRMHERGGPSRHSDTNQRDEHWVETRINTSCTRHRTTEFGAPSYAPSNSGNAIAASIAKVKSNGFMVAPDGTLVKAGGSCSSRKCQNSSPLYHGSPTDRDHRGFRSSRERVVSPDRFGGIRGDRTVRCAVEPAREQCHRPVISPSRSRQRSFSPHRGHIRHISPSHIGSRSRSRTRSPNPWFPPTARGRCLADHEPGYERVRSPPHRMRPDYDDRLGASNLARSNHHHIPPPSLRCVNDRRCTSPVNLMRSPPRNARFYQLDSPPPPLHRQREDFYHQPMHSGRGNGFNYRREFEEDRYDFVRPERHFERSVNGDGFRPRISSHKPFDSYRSNPRGLNRGIAGDLNHRSKEDRDSFKFTPGGRHNNVKYDKREMRDRNDGGDDAAARRRLP